MSVKKRKELAAVVIPIYKDEPTANELISFKQCLKVLKNHPIVIIHPLSLDCSRYTSVFEGQAIVRFEAFDDKYFKSVAGYSKLLTSIFFYKTFTSYKYILIYQLDSFVFRDELLKWCKLGYDYIGAPWVDTDVYSWFFSNRYPSALIRFHRYTGRRLIKYVGNGGLSLRKVSSFINNLTFFSNSAKTWPANEDLFFSHYVGTFNPFFRVAPVKLALQFSFDINASKCYELNGFQLPFCCHAWDRTGFPYAGNAEFWKPYIDDVSATEGR